MKKQLSLAVMMLFALVCNAQYTVGSLTEPLEQSVWQQSAWISAADAQVVTGKVQDGTRAADGASWYKQYAEPVVKKTPRRESGGRITYEERIVQQMPQIPKRKDRV